MERLVRILGCCAIGIVMTACLGEDPASFRGVDRLVTGHWTFISLLDEGVHSPDLHSIDIHADGTIEAASGFAGVTVSGYRAQFWQRGDVIGMRGTGNTLDGGVYVAFVRIDVTTDPVVLTLTEIQRDYVAEVMGKPELNAYTADDVRDGVRRLFGSTLPPEALGETERFSK